MGLNTKMVAIFTTMNCTLNCKLCGTFVPNFREAGIRYSADSWQVQQCIDELFKIYDYIEHIDFTGGEPLLWEGLGESLSYALNYRRQFGVVRVVTNGTLLPSEEVLSAILPFKSKVDFMIDNYGALSTKVTELKSVLDSNQIAYREIAYHDENQYFGGWIDYRDLSYKNYSDEELNRVYDTCMPAHNMCLAVFGSHLYQCTVAATGIALGKIPNDNSMESVSLLDKEITLEDKRGIAEQFGKRILTACRYCKGFDPETAERFLAAEQI